MALTQKYPVQRFTRKRAKTQKRSWKKKPIRKRPAKKVVTKRDVVKIINRRAESKYFNVTPISSLKGTGDAGLSMVLARTGYPQMRVLGFQTGNGLSTNNSAIDYGINAITPLHLARIFAEGDANGYDMDGSYVTPSLAMTTFNLQRTYLDTTSGSDQAIECTPYYCRMLRLSPRPKKTSYQRLKLGAIGFALLFRI